MANSRILIWLLVLTSLAISPISKASEWLHYFPASDSEAQQGFVRITNLSGIAGTVAISGTDDAGITSSGIVELSLDIDESIHINSQEIENGSTSKGLIGNLDDGSGAWRLYFSTDLDLAITGLFRNESGFVNTIHSTAKSSDGLRHTVPFFNPASNTNQASRLRLINTSREPNTFQITGFDDGGNAPNSTVSITVSSNASAEISAIELEEGSDFATGSFGDGIGKWRLEVTSALNGRVMSLLEDPNGNLSNLSNAVDEPNEDGEYVLNYVLPKGELTQSFLRIINPSDSEASITVRGIDDSGTQSSGNIMISLGPNQSTNFRSEFFEDGNESLFDGALGDGEGNWRLLVTSDQDIRVMGLFRTPQGFLNTLHDNTSNAGGTIHTVSFLNPGSNSNQVSFLRLNNLEPTSNTFVITGIDDDGDTSDGSHEIVVGPNGSAEWTAAELEAAGLGDGKGKWRLTITSTGLSSVQSLLQAPDNFLSNLSIVQADPALVGDPGFPKISAVTSDAGQVNLSWDRLAGVDSYSVYYSDEPFSETNQGELVRADSSDLEIIIDGLSEDTIYYFKVVVTATEHGIGITSQQISMIVDFIADCTGDSDSAIPAGISASSISVVQGDSVDISWSSTNAASCVASGYWSGTKSTSGCESVTTNSFGDQDFTITCGAESSSVTVTVNTEDSEGSCTNPHNSNIYESYLGVYDMPMPQNQFSDGKIKALGFKDYGVEWIYNNYKKQGAGWIADCTEDEYIKVMYRTTLRRLKEHGVTTAWIYNFGYWQDAQAEAWEIDHSTKHIDDSTIEYIAEEAKKFGMNIHYAWQFLSLDAQNDSLFPFNGAVYVDLPLLEKIMDAHEKHILWEANRLEQLGAGSMSADWSAMWLCFCGLDDELPEPERDELRNYYMERMGSIVQQIKGQFSGKVIVGEGIQWNDARVFDQVDGIIFNFGNLLLDDEVETATVDLIQSKAESYIKRIYENWACLDFQPCWPNSSATLPSVIFNLFGQSHANFLSKGWTEDGFCTEGTLDGVTYDCVQYEVETDFSAQAIFVEGLLRAIDTQGYFDSLGTSSSTGYWLSDTLIPDANQFPAFSNTIEGFPNFSQSVRGKPAEKIIKYWYTGEYETYEPAIVPE